MRTNRITVFVSQAELEAIDRARGSAKRGSFLRHSFTNRRQPQKAAFALNREAWLVLSRCAGTLETLAKMSVVGRADAEIVKREVASFREALICARTNK